MRIERSGFVKLPRLLAALVVMTFSVAATAGVVTEDFSYSPNTTPLSGKTGGSGWDGPWGIGTNKTSRVKAATPGDLSYSTGGYSITQSGTGMGYGDYNAFRGINRLIDADLAGTVWFSMLIQNTEAAGYSGLQFNNHSGASGNTDYLQGANHVGIRGTDLVVRYGGVDNTLALNLALNQAHLVVGRIVFGATNDLLEVWADPADLANLGSANFAASTADIGVNVFMAGVFGYSDVDSTTIIKSHFDALRLSDTSTAFTDVTGVTPAPIPTPAALPAGLALLGLVALKRRR